MEKSHYSIEQAKKDIELAIQQAGDGKYSTVIIDDSFWPFKTELTLTSLTPESLLL